MTALFVDTSALITAYLADEPDHAVFRELLFAAGNTVTASELLHVEATAAFSVAGRAGRISEARLATYVQRLNTDVGRSGRVRLVRFDRTQALPRARRLVQEHPVRTLDALHLAVAVSRARLAAPEPLTFVTRDDDQRSAAEAIGLTVM